MDPTQVLRGDDGVFTCRECGFRYALSGAEIARVCATTVVEVRAAALAVPESLRARRTAPEVWSPNAYCAHLADASELIEGRARRIVSEDRPLLRGYDQDEAAVRGCFDEVSMDTSLPRIEAARHGQADGGHVRVPGSAGLPVSTRNSAVSCIGSFTASTFGGGSRYARRSAGAAPLPPAVREAWLEHTGVALCEGYGMTDLLRRRVFALRQASRVIKVTDDRQEPDTSSSL